MLYARPLAASKGSSLYLIFFKVEYKLAELEVEGLEEGVITVVALMNDMTSQT